MEPQSRKPLILVAEDDQDDQFLITYALEGKKRTASLQFVSDGEELIGFLQKVKNCLNLEKSSLPDLILLDLNMPRVNGLTALEKIKADPVWQRIPVVVWTTSERGEDLDASVKLGASSFITKPPSLESLCQTLNTVVDFWMKKGTASSPTGQSSV